MSAALTHDYASFSLGFTVSVPHKKVTLIKLDFVFWTLHIVFGAKIMRG